MRAAVARRAVLGGAVALVLSTTSACELVGAQANGEDVAEETEAPGWLAIDAALAALIQPQRGQYRLQELPGLLIEVVPTEIRNREGEVVEVIGD